MMMSTHMAYGFVPAYLLTLFFAVVVAPSSYPVIMPVTAFLALMGLLGGIIPDVDSLESLGFVHKKTCHFIVGYLFAAIGLVVVAKLLPEWRVSTLALACVALGGWLHSFMDIFDGFRDFDPNQGIYEHLFVRRWLPSLQKVAFAGTWEWILQAFAALGFIAISANLSQLFVPGWQIATITYGGIWGVSVIYDVLVRAKRRQAAEFRYIRGYRGVR